MQFKGSIFYKFPLDMINFAEMNEFLSQKPFEPCPTDRAYSIGFAPVVEGGHYLFDVSIDHAFAMVNLDIKDIKAKKINRELDRRVRALEKDGKNILKEEKARIKDEIVDEFTRREIPELHKIPVIFNKKTGLMIVATTSQKKADIVTTTFRKTIGSFAITATNIAELGEKLKDAVIDHDEFSLKANSRITFGESITAKSATGTTATFSGFDVLDPDIRNYVEVADKLSKLELVWNDGPVQMGIERADTPADTRNSVTFTINEKGVLSSITYGSGHVADHDDNPEAKLAGDVIIVGALLQRIYDDLDSCLDISVDVIDVDAKLVAPGGATLLKFKTPPKDNWPEEKNLNDVDYKDELYDSAVEIVLEDRRASISYLQRRLKIGYNRAATFIEEMEKAGVVSEVQSNGTREVLGTSKQLH